MIALLEADTFKVLHSFIQLPQISDVPFQDLLKKPDEHFLPERFKESERAKSFSAHQEEHKSSSFLARLRTIAFCEYEREIDPCACSLLTAFIAGLRDQRLKPAWFKKSTWTSIRHFGSWKSS